MLNTIIAGFIWVLGLCVGSFLNVVIYRLPLGKSLSEPKRSYCPNCGTSIAAFDNIPVLSWFLLRGRCRSCNAVISPQYPLIEAVTGLVFVLTFYLLGPLHVSSHAEAFSHEHDWPLLLAWLTLVAAMIACSGMDFVSYMVDTRVTNFAVVAGLLLLAVWPRPEALVATAASPIAAGMAVATLTGLIWHAVSVPRFESSEPPDAPASGTPQASLIEPSSAPGDQSGARGGTSGVGIIGVLAMIALSVWLIASASTGRADEHAAPSLLRNWPTIASLVVLFIAMVISGSHPRDVDAEIAGVIESEGASARGTAWRELFWLLPAIVAGVVVAIATAHYPVVVGLWDGLVRWSPIAGFAPIAGTVYSLVGIFAGVAAGWFLRIFFTLVFGREAFGVGDIYILAAAGAVGGWQIALLGLLLSVGLATVGWLLSLIFKSTLIIPFGPWLALGFLMALWLERPAGEIAAIYRESIEIARRERPELLWLLGAIMLAGMAIAVVFARLARQLVAPHMTQHESALHVQTPSSESSSVAQPDPPINPETSDDARGA